MYGAERDELNSACQQWEKEMMRANEYQTAPTWQCQALVDCFAHFIPLE
jgi:hypothetical protein